MTLGRFDPLGEMEGDPIVGGPLTLASARRLAADVMRQRALGKDVIADHATAKRRRRGDYEQRAAQNFAVVAKRFITEYAKPRTRSWAVSAKLLGLSLANLEPVKGGLAERWRDKLVSEITPDSVHDLVSELRTKGAPGLKIRVPMSDASARVALLRLSKFFSWAVQSRLIATNPCSQVWRPPTGSGRERVLSDTEIKWLWRAAGDLGQPFGPAVRLLMLLGQRRGEVAGMRWDELSEDHQTWTLPGSRTKNGRGHVVPMPPLALDQVHGLHPVGTTFVFSTTGDVPVNGWTRVKRRLDERMAELAGSMIPAWTIHDLRRTCATGLQRLGIRLEVTESVLNHQSGSRAGIVSVYQKYQYGPEKTEALNLWAEYVEKITSG